MSKAVRIVVIVLAVGLMVFAGVQLGSYFYESIEENAINDELLAIADSPIDSTGDLTDGMVLEEPEAQNWLRQYTRRLFGRAAPGKAPISGNQTKKSLDRAQKRKINFKALKKRNKDIIAWISIPNAPIDYAVVRGKNNTFYLAHNALKRPSKSGAVFLDSKLRSDFRNLDSIVYGHRMRNGTMFGPLARYRNKKFRKGHRFIFVYTPETTYRYRVSSVFRTTQTKLKPDNSKTQTLTLVTCDGKKAHIVVRAKLVSAKKPGKK